MTHHASFCLTLQKNDHYVVQYKVQGSHWNKEQCTLHPVILHYKDDNNEVQCTSTYFLSNDLEHDTLNCNDRPVSTSKRHYRDGCTGQYEIFKNFLNLGYHSNDFGLRAIWSFFVTSHGKSPCDGLGGTVKRLLLRASLQRPVNDQILSFDKIMTFCTTSIKGITFFEINKDDMASVRERQKERYQLGNTVEGMKSSHHFEPQSCLAIRAKHLSAENQFSINHSFSLLPEEAHEQLIASSYGCQSR